MDRSILQLLAELDVDEMREALGALEAMIARALARGAAREPDRCPRCGCRHVVGKGRSASGARRWLCRGCGRTFSASTRGLLACSKLPPETWFSYAEGMCAGRTLRELAESCGVCLKTSWFMRMRICELMGAVLRDPDAGEGATWQVDGLYLDESLSGNRRRARVALPRGAHRRGHASGRRGISSLKLCVVCGASDLGGSFCTLAGRGRPTPALVARAMEPIRGAFAVNTDEHGAYPAAVAAVGARSHAAFRAGTPEAASGLGLVNALHARLRRFLAPFCGVSSRRLRHYLDWFSWTEQTRRADGRREDTLGAQLPGGTYESTRDALEGAPQPFWDYWEGR